MIAANLGIAAAALNVFLLHVFAAKSTITQALLWPQATLAAWAAAVFGWTEGTIAPQLAGLWTRIGLLIIAVTAVTFLALRKTSLLEKRKDGWSWLGILAVLSPWLNLAMISGPPGELTVEPIWGLFLGAPLVISSILLYAGMILGSRRNYTQALYFVGAAALYVALWFAFERRVGSLWVPIARASLIGGLILLLALIPTWDTASTDDAVDAAVD